MKSCCFISRLVSSFDYIGETEYTIFISLKGTNSACQVHECSYSYKIRKNNIDLRFYLHLPQKISPGVHLYQYPFIYVYHDFYA